MKQVLQDLRSGSIVLEDVPVPSAGPNDVIIRTHCSLISAGTERMVNSFANASYLQKARQQPDRVREVLQKARTDGMATTVEAVQNKLDERVALGYCNAGEVIAVGAEASRFAVGDRVISNGPHAQVVRVSQNLVAKIPDGVHYEHASYTVAAAIGLQGVRLIQPTLGERVAVFGLGLVGLLAVQVLRANGCRVIGFDFAADRVEIARTFGAEAHDLSSGLDPVAAANVFTGNVGIDAVLVTASTSSNELMHQAAEMSRQRGRIVLTGVVGLDLKRNDFYEKELEFSVSCSYGPGRYDSSYEQDGIDYPIGYVRWTEQRNFEAVLDLLADRALDVAPLTTRVVPFSEAAEAYQALGEANDIGIVLKYEVDTPPAEFLAERTVRIVESSKSGSLSATVGVIGAGAFANGVLLPGLSAANARIKSISSSGGTSGSAAARRFDIETSTTDNGVLFGDPEIDAVVISTRHDTHARLVVAALEADKDVFVEKPLAIDQEGLDRVIVAFESATNRRGQSPLLMVGFNRRFAPTTQQLRDSLASRSGPAAVTFMGNTGAIPASHWTQDPAIGGGRIVGEGCHYIDYVMHLVGSPIVAVSAIAAPSETLDIASISLSFEDGSIGTVQYLANGSKALAKERCEVFFDGRVLQLDNFRSVKGHGVKMTRKVGERQRKGHPEQFAAFVAALRGDRHSPIPFSELVNVTEASFAAVRSVETGQTINLDSIATET